MNEILNRLNNLTALVNGIIDNAKKIFQLPTATAGSKLIAVYNEDSTQTEQLNISNYLEQLDQLNNRVITFGNVTRDVNTFTFEVGFEWQISSVLYANTTNIERTIAEANENYYRIDIAVVDTNNDIVIVQGFENLTIATQPDTPPNTILLKIFNIFGDVIDNPIDPPIDTTTPNLQQVTDEGYDTTNPLLVKEIDNSRATEIRGYGLVFSADAGNFGMILEVQTPTGITGTGKAVLKDVGDDTETIAYQSYVDDELANKADLVGGLIPSSQLPATVDEILEGYYVNSYQFDDTDFIPYVPSSNKYYLDLNSNKTYRWSGSTYVPINEGIALGETSSTAYRGDRGKIAYDHSQASDNPHGTTAAQVGAYTTIQVDTIAATKSDKPQTLRVTSNIPLTATTSSQKLFGSLGDNGDGSFTLAVGRYKMDMIITLTNLAGSGSIGFLTGLGDGTSAFSNIAMAVSGFKASLSGAGSAIFTRMTSFTSNPSVSGTGSNTNGFIQVSGEFSVTTAGKFFPGISLNVSATPDNNAGSFCTITKVD